MVEMPSSISSVGRELVHSAMLRMPCLFWPATFQIFCGTLDGLVKVQKAYLMTLPKSTADQSTGMECRHALEPSSAMCVTCTPIAMLSRLMKKSRGTTDMRAVSGQQSGDTLRAMGDRGFAPFGCGSPVLSESPSARTLRVLKLNHPSGAGRPYFAKTPKPAPFGRNALSTRYFVKLPVPFGCKK